MIKAEKVLLVLILSMLIATATLAAFGPPIPRGFQLFPEVATKSEPTFTGSIVVEIAEGKAVNAIAITGKNFAPYECGETGKTCPDARELLQNLGSAAFVVDGERLTIASSITP